jgi:hypothetical protein
MPRLYCNQVVLKTQQGGSLRAGVYGSLVAIYDATRDAKQPVQQKPEKNA